VIKSGVFCADWLWIYRYVIIVNFLLVFCALAVYCDWGFILVWWIWKLGSSILCPVNVLSLFCLTVCWFVFRLKHDLPVLGSWWLSFCLGRWSVYPCGGCWWIPCFVGFDRMGVCRFGLCDFWVEPVCVYHGDFGF
jgi:hypothetical protein